MNRDSKHGNRRADIVERREMRRVPYLCQPDILYVCDYVLAYVCSTKIDLRDNGIQIVSDLKEFSLFHNLKEMEGVSFAHSIQK